MDNLTEYIAECIREAGIENVYPDKGQEIRYEKQTETWIQVQQFPNDILFRSLHNLIIGQILLRTLAASENEAIKQNLKIIKLGFIRDGELGWPEQWPAYIGGQKFWYWAPVGNIDRTCDEIGNGFINQNILEYQLERTA